MYIFTRKFILPKPSVLTSTGSYKGFANGQDVSNYLVVDGSNKTADVAHFMLTKPIVLQIASQHNNNTKQGNETGTAATGAGNATSSTSSTTPNSNSNTNSSSIMSFTLMPSKNGSKSQGNCNEYDWYDNDDESRNTIKMIFPF